MHQLRATRRFLLKDGIGTKGTNVTTRPVAGTAATPAAASNSPSGFAVLLPFKAVLFYAPGMWANSANIDLILLLQAPRVDRSP